MKTALSQQIQVHGGSDEGTEWFEVLGTHCTMVEEEQNTLLSRVNTPITEGILYPCDDNCLVKHC